MVRYIYYLEGSTVVLKCLSYSERMEWFGTAHTKIYRQIQVSDMFGHRRMWNITLYTDCQFIISTLSNRNRLRLDNFDLQIINASILDEGLYFYGTSFYSYDGVWYILKMISKLTNKDLLCKNKNNLMYQPGTPYILIICF